LYSFSYKEKFGRMPYGELSHGWPGILEFYQNLFRVDNNKAVLGLLNVLATGSFRGHSRCPCGSRKRVRDCHGGFLGNMLRIQPESAFKNEYNHLIDYLLKVQRFKSIKE
jgi:hypothetical protein